MQDFPHPGPQVVCVRDERPRIRPVGDNDMVKPFLEGLTHVPRLTSHGRRPFNQPPALRGMFRWWMSQPGNNAVEANVVDVLGSVFLLIPVDDVVRGTVLGALGIRVRAVRHDILEVADCQHYFKNFPSLEPGTLTLGVLAVIPAYMGVGAGAGWPDRSRSVRATAWPS